MSFDMARTLIQQIDAACCTPLTEGALTEREAERMANALKVLADPARLRLVSLLVNSPGGEICQCDVTEPLGLSQPTVSHHFRVLADAGIVAREKRGRWVYYRLICEPLAALAEALAPPAERLRSA